MTTPHECSYARRGDVLWRTLGDDLLALPAGCDAAVLVRGGSALLWRLLDRPLDIPTLVSELAGGETGPTAGEVASALEQMLTHDLIERREA